MKNLSANLPIRTFGRLFRSGKDNHCRIWITLKAWDHAHGGTGIVLIPEAVQIICSASDLGTSPLLPETVRRYFYADEIFWRIRQGYVYLKSWRRVLKPISQESEIIVSVPMYYLWADRTAGRALTYLAAQYSANKGVSGPKRLVGRSALSIGLFGVDARTTRRWCSKLQESLNERTEDPEYVLIDNQDFFTDNEGLIGELGYHLVYMKRSVPRIRKQLPNSCVLSFSVNSGLSYRALRILTKRERSGIGLSLRLPKEKRTRMKKQLSFSGEETPFCGKNKYGFFTDSYFDTEESVSWRIPDSCV
jgi:hypothetical protein